MNQRTKQYLTDNYSNILNNPDYNTDILTGFLLAVFAIDPLLNSNTGIEAIKLFIIEYKQQ